jgi:hypothetical protein
MAGEANDFYLTANNNSFNRKVVSELWDDIVQIPEYLAYDCHGGFRARVADRTTRLFDATP